MFRVEGNLSIFGSHDENTIRQMKRVLSSPLAESGVLCADGHLGYAMPIGGVAVYEKHVSPSGVGYDISCGNMAALTDMAYEDLMSCRATIAHDVFNTISFGVGRTNNERVDHALFDSDSWKVGLIHHLKEMARGQLGTVGSGNHYVDIFIDESKRVWIGVHFGSRGLGHKTATAFLKAGGARDGMDVEPLLLEVGTPIGDDYLTAMNLAGQYAYAGREWVVGKVASILGASVVESVHNHHNFCWKETHDGREVYVVRKGATPAFPGQRGFVGGSMGDNAVIVEGVDSEESKLAFYSTVHGAGRVMSRTAARGKINRKTGGVVSVGAVSRDDMMKWVREFDVTLCGADTDESPQAYKRLGEVLVHHAGSIKIVHTLKPVIVCMAGRDTQDPYGD